jgi:septal ring factor EnvC (AmiA/AmiB activator)
MACRISFAVGRFAVALTLALAAAVAGAQTSSQLDRVVAQRIEGNQAGTQSQVQIDKLSDETDKLAAEYRSVLQQIDALRIYNRQVEELIVAQEEEVASLRDQIDDVELVGRQVIPLMLEMVAALDSFVELDVPFLPEERSSRIAALHELLGRADVTDAERFRRILEAYQVENEYGRTIEAYSGELELEGKSRTVDFLRVGRVVFIYRTRDGAEVGAWDQKARAWETLSSDYHGAVLQGLRIARKQAAPDLLRLPVPAAEAVQ